MSSARTTSIKSLARLAQQTPHVRHLHMTGAAAQPRMPLVEKARTLPAASREQKPQKSSSNPRQFNTSRSLKAVADSSPVDLAFLPTFPTPVIEYGASPLVSRIPLMPVAEGYEAPSHAAETPFLASVQAGSTLKPVISTVAAESTHIHAPSAMSDVHDGAHHDSIDFHDIVSTISSGAEDVSRKVMEVPEVNQATGLLKGAWTGLMEDVFGPKVVATPATA